LFGHFHSSTGNQSDFLQIVDDFSDVARFKKNRRPVRLEAIIPADVFVGSINSVLRVGTQHDNAPMMR
jgi:hypothetical protein